MAYKIAELTRVAEMYYEDNLKQACIARRLGISKYAVSRMLQKAVKEGLVQIKIIKPNDYSSVC